MGITVKDTGIGIPTGESKSIGTPGYRASNVGSVQGTGIGLNVVKDWLLRMGGAIDINPFDPPGTEITVVLSLHSLANHYPALSGQAPR